MENKNKNNRLYILVGILCILVLILGGYIVYDKVLTNHDGNITNNNQSTKNNTNQNINKVYSKNESVEVNVGNNISEKFFVISDNGDNLTLISQNILFKTRFYDYDGDDCISPNELNDGNSSGCIVDYEKSTLKSKLLEYTKNWNNIIDVRILTVKEVADNTIADHKCGENCFRAKKFEKFLSLGNDSTGEYWLNNEKTDGTNGFANFVSIWKDNNTNDFYINVGQYFVNAPYEKGCKPVITISKEYVK